MIDYVIHALAQLSPMLVRSSRSNSLQAASSNANIEMAARASRPAVTRVAELVMMASWHARLARCDTFLPYSRVR